jgi:hypothetical protein
MRKAVAQHAAALAHVQTSAHHGVTLRTQPPTPPPPPPLRLQRIGNSGGLGGAFGFMWALGVPFPYPEGKPWTSSLQQRVRVCVCARVHRRVCVFVLLAMMW